MTDSVRVCSSCNGSNALSSVSCAHCGHSYADYRTRRSVSPTRASASSSPSRPPSLHSAPSSPSASRRLVTCAACRASLADAADECVQCAPLATLRVGGRSFTRVSLEELFANVELEDLLQAILRDSACRSFFCSAPVLRRLVWLLSQPVVHRAAAHEIPTSPGSPRKDGAAAAADVVVQEPTAEDERASTLARIQVYVAEILTNPDSSDVFDALLRNADLLEYFFSFWRNATIDPALLTSLVRLCDFILQKRFHAFVRCAQEWSFVIPGLVMHLEAPEVRTLIHAMVANEALLERHVPELRWSQQSIFPLLLLRFRTAVESKADAFEVITMCEFLGDLLWFHYDLSPHVVQELLGVFETVSSLILSSHPNEFTEEFQTLFMKFFPPRFPDQGLMDLPTTVPVSELVHTCVDVTEWPKPVVWGYFDVVEVYLTSPSFQRSIRVALSKELGVKPSMQRWRALQIVSRMVQMCSSEVDEALIVSGNLQRCLDAFFDFPQASMIHSLVVNDLLSYMLRYSPEATVCWTLAEYGLVKRALKAYNNAKAAQAKPPSYTGHLIVFFNALAELLDTSDVVAAAVESASPDVAEDFAAFRRTTLLETNRGTKYSFAPPSVEREGSLLERLAAAESEEDTFKKQKEVKKEDEQHEAKASEANHHEEVVEEEVVVEEEEEVVVEEEEVVEEVVEEEE